MTSISPTPSPTADRKPPKPKTAAKVSLCVEVTRSQASSRRGETARWVISAWTTGGNVPDSTLRLKTSPASQTPKFSFGCGSNDGTASCDLGAMDAKAAKRQLQAQVTVPADAFTVTSVTLTAIGSAAHLPRDPMAAARVTSTAAVTATPPATATPPLAVTAPLAVTSLPAIPSASPTLSPGGNAAGLFPALRPSAHPSKTRVARSRKLAARPVANTSALPEGAPVVGAQLVGLVALALAFFLAVTRLSIRRRPAPPQPAPAAPAPAPAVPTAAEPTPTPQVTAEPAAATEPAAVESAASEPAASGPAAVTEPQAETATETATEETADSADPPTPIPDKS